MTGPDLEQVELILSPQEQRFLGRGDDRARRAEQRASAELASAIEQANARFQQAFLQAQREFQDVLREVARERGHDRIRQFEFDRIAGRIQITCERPKVIDPSRKEEACATASP